MSHKLLSQVKDAEEGGETPRDVGASLLWKVDPAASIVAPSHIGERKREKEKKRKRKRRPPFVCL